MLFCFYVGKGARLVDAECTKAKMRELYADFLAEACSHSYRDFVSYLERAGVGLQQLHPCYFVFSAEDQIEQELRGEVLESSAPIKLGDAHMKKLYGYAQKSGRTAAQQIVRMVELYETMESFAHIIYLLQSGELKRAFNALNDL